MAAKIKGRAKKAREVKSLNKVNIFVGGTSFFHIALPPLIHRNLPSMLSAPLHFSSLCHHSCEDVIKSKLVYTVLMRPKIRPKHVYAVT